MNFRFIQINFCLAKARNGVEELTSSYSKRKEAREEEEERQNGIRRMNKKKMKMKNMEILDIFVNA